MATLKELNLSDVSSPAVAKKLFRSRKTAPLAGNDLNLSYCSSVENAPASNDTSNSSFLAPKRIFRKTTTTVLKDIGNISREESILPSPDTSISLPVKKPFGSRGKRKLANRSLSLDYQASASDLEVSITPGSVAKKPRPFSKKRTKDVELACELSFNASLPVVSSEESFVGNFARPFTRSKKSKVTKSAEPQLELSYESSIVSQCNENEESVLSECVSQSNVDASVERDSSENKSQEEALERDSSENENHEEASMERDSSGDANDSHEETRMDLSTGKNQTSEDVERDSSVNKSQNNADVRKSRRFSKKLTTDIQPTGDLSYNGSNTSSVDRSQNIEDARKSRPFSIKRTTDIQPAGDLSYNSSIASPIDRSQNSQDARKSSPFSKKRTTDIQPEDDLSYNGSNTSSVGRSLNIEGARKSRRFSKKRTTDIQPEDDQSYDASNASSVDKSQNVEDTRKSRPFSKKLTTENPIPGDLSYNSSIASSVDRSPNSQDVRKSRPFSKKRTTDNQIPGDLSYNGSIASSVDRSQNSQDARKSRPFSKKRTTNIELASELSYNSSRTSLPQASLISNEGSFVGNAAKPFTRRRKSKVGNAPLWDLSYESSAASLDAEADESESKSQSNLEASLEIDSPEDESLEETRKESDSSEDKSQTNEDEESASSDDQNQEDSTVEKEGDCSEREGDLSEGVLRRSEMPMPCADVDPISSQPKNDILDAERSLLPLSPMQIQISREENVLAAPPGCDAPITPGSVAKKARPFSTKRTTEPLACDLTYNASVASIEDSFVDNFARPFTRSKKSKVVPQLDLTYEASIVGHANEDVASNGEAALERDAEQTYNVSGTSLQQDSLVSRISLPNVSLVCSEKSASGNFVKPFARRNKSTVGKALEWDLTYASSIANDTNEDVESDLSQSKSQSNLETALEADSSEEEENESKEESRKEESRSSEDKSHSSEDAESQSSEDESQNNDDASVEMDPQEADCSAEEDRLRRSEVPCESSAKNVFEAEPLLLPNISSPKQTQVADEESVSGSFNDCDVSFTPSVGIENISAAPISPSPSVSSDAASPLPTTSDQSDYTKEEIIALKKNIKAEIAEIIARGTAKGQARFDRWHNVVDLNEEIREGRKFAPKMRKPRRNVVVNATPKVRYPRQKLYKPAKWANARLYEYLAGKLNEEFDLRRYLKAEDAVRFIHKSMEVVMKDTVYQKNAIQSLKVELAKLKIVETTDDFYNFIRSYLPNDFAHKVIPCLQPFSNIVWPPKDNNKRSWERILD